jgi:hypothetical protein
MDGRLNHSFEINDRLQVSALWQRATKKKMAQLNIGGLNLYGVTAICQEGN